MPKILFIQPTQYGHNKKLCKQKQIYLPGLVFPLLAAMTPGNWEYEVIIEVVDDIPFDSDADIIGIGTMGHAAFRGVDIAKEFKKRGKVVVMGGYMVSMVPRMALEFVDSVVVGDAELSYPRMLRDYEKNKKLESMYNNPVTSLAGLPVPVYRLLTEKKIGTMLPVQAGRGCNNSCSFCSISCLYQGNYMVRPVDEVIRDIQAIKDLGFKEFYLIDDNIVSNPSYLEVLCKEIEPLKMKWASQCSLHLAKNERLLKLVARSGGNLLSFGIESITQEGLDKYKKEWLKVDEHEELINRITDAGILVSSEMIIGTDSDTEESIKATYDFIEKVRLPAPRFYIVTPIPGTQLYHELKSANRLITEDYTRYTGTECVHTPEKLSAEKTNALFWWLLNKVYSIKSILRRTIFNPKAYTNLPRHIFAFFVNLHYRKYVKKRIPPVIF